MVLEIFIESCNWIFEKKQNWEKYTRQTDPVILLLELCSSDLLASEHVFTPELFEKEGK